jgi:NAD+ kinase
MKVLIYGKNAHTLTDLIKQHGLEIVEEEPEVIISYGGDGTLLTAERVYPGVPKLPIRDSKVCNKCSNHTNEVLIESLSNNTLELEYYPKLEAETEGNFMTALNDIAIRNSLAFHAIRFNLFLNGQLNPDALVIGDGLVVSTAFGSTGYFQSITRQTFEVGFKIGFNNTVRQLDPVEFNEGDVLKVVIVRGPGHLTSDNNPEIIELIEKKEVVIKVSNQKAKIYSAKTLRCSDCVVRREERLDQQENP